jgi:hypothetical protein
MQSNHNGYHRFVRIKSKAGISKQYRCGKDGCPTILHYEIIIGRIGECWRCKQPFTINKRSLRNKYLHCLACTNGRLANKEDSVDSLLSGIFDLPTSTEFESKDLK